MAATNVKLSKVVRFVLVLPVRIIGGIPLGLLACGATVYAYSFLLIGAIQAKWKMRRCARFTSEKRLREIVLRNQTPGTFILESYSIGFPVGRVWWTPETILNEAGDLPAESLKAGDFEACTPAHGRIYDAYTNLKTGKASLCKAWARRDERLKLQRLFPSIPILELWSGGVIMQRLFESRKESATAR